SQTIVRALLYVWVLHAGYGILGLAWVTVATNLLGWIAAIVAAKRVLPELMIRPSFCSLASLRELMTYGGFNVLVTVGEPVLLYTSQLVIGRIYGDPQAMTWYSMGSSLIVYFMQFVTSITWAFTPFVTARWATGNMDDVRRVLHVG